jgi:hypothetical protein
MRRWHLLNRLRRGTGRPDPERCFLMVEELEAREVLSPVIFVPTIDPVNPPTEGFAYTFSSGFAFSVSENSEGGPDYQADITATNGTISVAASPDVTNNDSSDVTITGTLNEINSLLSGMTFQPTAYYSGNSSVTLTVTDQAAGDETDTETLAFTVAPVASTPAFSVQAQGEVWAPSSGFVFPPGFVSVAPWPDLDGSETVTVSFSLDAANTDEYTLSAGGVPLTPIEPGFWEVSGTDPAALQATLDSLVLTPPAGFNGFADLAIFASNSDQPLDGSTQPDSAFLGFADVSLRFFIGGNVTTPAVSSVEGGSIDLGNRFVASDPDEMFGDTHTLTLSVPGGTLTLNSALVPEGLSASRDTAVDGSTTITLLGDVATINGFLATPGCMTYTPASPFFSGAVPLTITLSNQPGDFSDEPSFAALQSFAEPASQQSPVVNGDSAPNAFTGVAALSFAPVADHAFPSASDATTNQDTPVALSLGVSALADTDGSETVSLVLEGVPAGATLNHGTDLGGGQWALSPSDLAELTFTPPPGASGVYTLTLKAVVTDSAPDLGLSDSATESTTFTVTVIPAPVTVSPPVPVPIPPPPVVPQLPPAGTAAAAPSGATFTASTPTASGGTVTTPANDASPQPLLRTVNFNAYSSGGNDNQMSSTETQVSNSPPVPGSLFAQVEAPLPSYAYGEKHPLPPVLPLDQTLPVAGFSDSGGDSFALIDKLYRDAAAERFSAVNPQELPPPSAAMQAAFSIVSVVWTAPAPTLTVAPDREDDPAAPEAAPVTADPPGGNPPQWLAATAAAGGLAAWAWLARGSHGRLTRSVFRLLRTLHRRPTQRTA